MVATFFIGDPHLYHPLVAELRGFEDVTDHNVAIVRKWRKQVNENDIVYVTGDCAGGGSAMEKMALELLATLPGRKRLIAGNHDSVAGQHTSPSPNRELFHSVFEKISDHGRVSLNGKRILLSHYPYWESGDGPVRSPARYQQWRLPDLGDWLIHAHTHFTHPTSGSATGREICTSWDAWGRLVDMGDISQIIRKAEV